MYARIRNDVTRSDWDFLSRTDPKNPLRVRGMVGKQAPQTCRYAGGKSSIALPSPFQKLATSLNNPRAMKYLQRDASGWVNRRGGSYPKVQQLSFGENLVDVTSIIGNKCFVRYLNTKNPIPAGINFDNTPELIHLFTVVNPNGSVVLPDPPGATYLFMVSDAPVYFELFDVEMFPTLPFTANLNFTMLTRDAPNGDMILGRAMQDTMITISEYKCLGRDVWGMIGVDRWIALCHHNVTGLYTTSWHMDTNPPAL